MGWSLSTKITYLYQAKSQYLSKFNKIIAKANNYWSFNILTSAKTHLVLIMGASFLLMTGCATLEALEPTAVLISDIKDIL